LWAGIISFAQVYVGVHFPLDVIGGGILGIFTGYIVAIFFSKRVDLANNEIIAIH
jgi:undecaprenyl-diphosphatase